MVYMMLVRMVLAVYLLVLRMIMAVYLVGDGGDDSDVHVGREIAGDYDHGSVLFVVITVMLIGGDGGQDDG